MKKILLCITGSIAACNAPNIIRQMQRYNLDVHCILTTGGAEFVTAQTLAAMSGNSVLSNDIFDQKRPSGIAALPEYPHLHIADDVDGIVIAPATCDTIARLAHGRCNGLMETIFLTRKIPTVIAPAMNTQMLEAEQTRANINHLKSNGVIILETGEGTLACGDVGAGKLIASEIIALAAAQSVAKHDLVGKKILITLGATREPIDPVRYISNGSSGRMGLALAEQAYIQGADVTIVAGHTEMTIPDFCMVKKVSTAAEMLTATQEFIGAVDIALFAAAVGDYSVKNISGDKMPSGKSQNLSLIPTTDIAAECGMVKKPGQFFLGFALQTETGNAAIKIAKEKMRKKNIDAVFLNGTENMGSDSATGILISSNQQQEFSGKKSDVASKIFSLML